MFPHPSNAVGVSGHPVKPRWPYVYLRSNFGPIQEGDWATFSAASDITRCSTYLIFTAFLTAECSTVELPGIRTGRHARINYTSWSSECTQKCQRSAPAARISLSP